MSFTNSLFLIGLLPPFVFIYLLSAKSRNLRTVLLALANMVFLIFGGIYSLIALLIESLLAYLFAKSLLKRQRRTKLLIFAGILLLPLFVYKLFSALAINAIGILGISFFTFEAISLVADAYNLKYQELNYWDVLLYLTFFVTITSGPIIRFPSFRKSLDSCSVDLNAGIERFAIGLCKKLLLADKLAILADYYFDGVAIGLELSSLGLFIGSIAYSLQLYYDFSGYSDMAIGIGHMLGFDIIENFKQPYKAKGVQDFWRRWHISLSQWFRDYVYIPLGGNRKGNTSTIGNMLVVWLLTGIWHGFDWTFIIWGLGHYLLLLAERFVPFVKSVATGTFSHLYTLFLVNLLWIPFRAENIKCLASYLRGILSFKGNIEDIATGFWPLMAIGIIFLLIPNRLIEKAEKNTTCQIIKTIILAVLFFYAICALLNATYTPYIYGNF